MEKNNELNLEQMEAVTGGVWHTVNTGKPGVNAAVRLGPSTGTSQVMSLPNGTRVNTVSDDLIYDPVAGRNFVKVKYFDKNGVEKEGYIASSILGLKR